MKTTQKWLNELCPSNLTIEQTAALLTRAGFEVESMETVGDDTLFSLDITANHADWLGAIGIAREIAANTGIPAMLPISNLNENGPDIHTLTSVEVNAPDLCPLYIARVVSGIKMVESPLWLRNRLELIGLRPVNAVVDITNYLMYETGQPLHAFDLNKLEGRRIVVRRANKGEKMTAINGKELSLDESILVIADSVKPVAIAGVMGGIDSEISSNTTDVLIECAVFNAPATRRTARKIGITSDSSSRFERGTDLEKADYVAARCAELIAKFCFATIAKGAITVGAVTPPQSYVTVRISRIERLLGFRVDPERVFSILTNLGFRIIESEEESITVAIPSWRKDVSREADLIEEIVRITGYESIPETVDLRVFVDPMPDSFLKRRKLRTILTGMGLDESVIDPFLEPRFAQAFAYNPALAPVSLANPPRSDMNSLRTSLVPGMLKVLKGNRDRNIFNVNIFEIERIYTEQEKHPVETELLGLLIEGSFFDLKGIVESMLEVFTPKAAIEFRPSARPQLENGLCLELLINGKYAGYLGTLNANSTALLDLKSTPSVAEIEAQQLYDVAGLPLRSFEQGRIPRYPSVERDFAFVVDESVQWNEVERTVRGSSKEVPIEAIRFFDIYRGKQVPDGKKSIALKVVFRSPDSTLTEQRIASAMDAIIGGMAAAFQATLRS